MGIDFSKLDAIKKPQEATEITVGTGTQSETKKPTESDLESDRSTIRLNQQKEDHQKTLEVGREYQNNIKASEQLQTEILKGVKSGEAPEILLLKACKAIAQMTGNKLFYNQIEEDLIAIYGEGLLDPVVLQEDLARVEDRLNKLEKSLGADWIPTDGKARIERAVSVHRKRRADILELINNTKQEGGVLSG